MVVLIFAGSADTLIRIIQEKSFVDCGFHINFVLSALESETVISFVPILSVLPFAGSYVDDVKSKFARYLLVRSSYSAYLVARIVVCYLCGGFLIISGIFVAWASAALIFAPLERVGSISSEYTTFALKTCLLFLNGGFWSVVGMAMSTLMESKYISYATPFVFYYLLVILYERYFSDLFIIYPKIWTDPAAWPFGCWGAAIFLLEMTLIFAILFVFRARRRLQQL